MKVLYKTMESVGVNPNQITAIGLGMTAVGATTSTVGGQAWMGLGIYTVGRALDLLDGKYARYLQAQGKWGPQFEGESFDAHCDKVGIYISLLLVWLTEYGEHPVMGKLILGLLASDSISTYLRKDADWKKIKESLIARTVPESDKGPQNTAPVSTHNAANTWGKIKATLQTVGTGVALVGGEIPYGSHASAAILGSALVISIPSLVKKIRKNVSTTAL